ncbi:PAAR domain-containing protein [Massilia sp. P8910]|uniref:PAAR domain-containing protein n=1 Tax=Massilia antarctica TaxID=2765360 RepID=UPI001E3C95DA|nr:PAAR domain-containing protein [Massilia antarctica]MCE3602670.1 PAAR domain-containing protein [Massilia antarctica]
MAQAARISDPIGHSPTMSWLLAGLLAGAAIAVAAVAIVGTGGLAAVAMVGAGAAMGAGLGEAMSTMSWAPKEVSGMISGLCSFNVFTNGKPAARAHLDMTLCAKHPQAPLPIATGSATVFINGMPAARVDDTIACSAVITSGSNNVNIGGGTVQTDNIAPEELVPGWVHAALLVVGIGSAVVLAGPLLAVAGLAGGLLGGLGGGWLGGAIFGEGSDGQKWSALGGSLIGGLLGAKGGSAWEAARAARPNQSVSIIGFRGAGKPVDLLGENPPHPYEVTGHVGYSLDGGKTIYGFGPDVPKNMTAFEAVQSLREGTMYKGIITDDTAVFAEVAKNPSIGRDGAPQVVIEQKIPMTQAQYDAVVAAHEARGVKMPMDDLLYGFPKEGGCTFNCATYPSQMGIPIPETTGNMRTYMPALEEVGVPWVPKE